MGGLSIFLFVLLMSSSPATGAEPLQVARVTASRAQPVIEIWKKRREMELRTGERVLRRFRVALGLSPELPKRQRGDLRTPVGRYFVCEKLPRSRFRRFLGLNYPNEQDAEGAYAEHIINATEWAGIFLENLRGGVPPWYTPLGGRVGIHGYGGRPELKVDWTEGCIAVGDEEIEYLYQRVPLGTPVIIHE
jgi:murein L,D-transpeptidase YafK